MSQKNPANSKACAKYYEKNKEVMKEKMMGYYIKTRDEVNEKKATDPEFCKLMKEKYRLKNEKHKHTIIKKSLEDLIEHPLTAPTKKEMLRTLIGSGAYKALTPKNMKPLIDL